jgi:SAM-dependent methyltransferase
MSNKGLKLDVGCGAKPTGNVNCDLFIKDTGHWTGKIDQRRLLSIKKIPNFVICDSQQLPFRTGAFDVVYCSHLIEHVDNPFMLFKELNRVSNHKTIIKCPHRLGERMFLPKNPFHLNFFKSSWFILAARKSGLSESNVNVRISQYKYFPSAFFFLFRVPFEITTIIDQLKRSYSEEEIDFAT